MATTTEQFSLRWNNFHSNLQSGFHELLQQSEMVDVTLAVDGQFLQAHKIVLSICSPYFKEMFKANPCKHPIVILKDVAHENMKDILQFMYMGEVSVLRDNLSSFLSTAEILQIKGLTGDDNTSENSAASLKKENHNNTKAADSIEDQNDLFNQLIETTTESETSSTPLNYNPSQISPLPLNCVKKQAKLLSLPNSKRLKPSSDLYATAYNIKLLENVIPKNTTNLDYKNCDLIQLRDIKSEECENEEAKDYSKSGINLWKSNLLTNTHQLNAIGPDQTSTEQDNLLYSTDRKTGVTCQYCCRKFVNRYNLKVHIRDKHDSKSTDLDCQICGKTMRNQSCLRVHMYHHRKQQLESAGIVS